ncbi:MAG: DNA/RNA non-specific endonuclease [candidate division WOR-3 bacterium]
MRPKQVLALGWVAAVLVSNCGSGSSAPAHTTSGPDSVILDTVFDALRAERWVVPVRGRSLAKYYYYVCYADSWRIPYWVLHYVSRPRLAGNISRSDNFRSDSMLPEELRVRPGDYRRTGFDKGHLAPAADFAFDPAAMSATFLMSNMSPQYPGTNRGTWRKVEEEVRAAIKRQGQGWVITGNVFIAADSSRIAPAKWLQRNRQNWVAVPTHLFKAVLLRDSAGRFRMLGFLVPNQAGQTSPLVTDHIIPVRRLEEITGWDFFPLLPDLLEDSLETRAGALN